MITNREMNLDDYLAMSRRRMKVILVPTLLVTVAGFLISFAFSPSYTSKSLVLVERQTVPAGYVRPIVTASVRDRIITLQQQILSRSRLLAMVNLLGLATKGKSVDAVIDQIQSNVSITEADSLGSSAASSSNSAPRSGDVPGFYVSFTADDPGNAQKICGELTSMLLEENLKSREQVALSTTDFLSRQLDEAKNNLDEKDKKLAAFKGLYIGQLPGDVENNLKVLETLNSQLDANTWQLNRAQQDKSYAESVLAQQLGAWKSSQTSLTSETIGQKLAALQTQLVTLQARYTDDYPEVVKLKSDIAGLQAKQKEMGAPSDQKTETDRAGGKGEPPEILQLRQQIHQAEVFIARATDEQKRLQGLISAYQGRLTLSPKVEEDYKQLTRDYETAYKVYDSLLLNKSESEIQTNLEHQQQGEQMRLLDAANLPDFPSFPVRWKFAAYGLVAGLALGISIAMWLELRDKAIRNEEDVEAGTELPMLVSIPWVGPLAIDEPNGVRGRLKSILGQRKTAGV
ncbi:MAG: GNVR domain-containing protein [Candidatus Sulfotelmatobacter sp.]